MQDGDEEFMAETQRKLKKMMEFDGKLSDVWRGKIFISGFKVAQKLQSLENSGITHVINTAGDYCTNPHQHKFQYLTLYIKDSKSENIECIFYTCFDFIDQAIKSNGKVLVHCVQGVSRSVTVCIAYLMYAERMKFHQAMKVVKKGRGIASPNIGFIAQLMMFERKLGLNAKNIEYP